MNKKQAAKAIFRNISPFERETAALAYIESQLKSKDGAPLQQMLHVHYKLTHPKVETNYESAIEDFENEMDLQKSL